MNVDIDQVQTQVVRDTLWSYREFYYLHREGLPNDDRGYRFCGCSETTGKWPNNHDSDGLPCVCEAHEWQSKRATLQAAAVSSGLSMPIPRIAIDVDGQKIVKNRVGPSVYKNPLLHFPQIVTISGGSTQAGNLAGWIAKWLSATERSGEDRYRMEHVVFYIHHSQVIDLLYERRNGEVKDALLWAPIMVYLHNYDGRRNGQALQMINSRQYGLAFIVKE